MYKYNQIPYTLNLNPNDGYSCSIEASCIDFIASSVAQVKPIDSVVAVARVAKARGLPIAVASGGSTSNVRTGLASTGILHLFDAVVCAEVQLLWL